MKKIIYRVLAYGIDILLISLLVIGLMNLPMFKKTNELVGIEYLNLSTTELAYNTLSNKLEEYYKDAKFSQEELKEIENGYNDYYDCFKDVKVDEEITNEMKTKITTNLKEKEVNLKNKSAYKINKYNISQSIMGIVLYILYFGIIQFLLKGQTLGKKIFRLKVKRIDDEKGSLISYIIRSILVCEIIITGIDLLLLITLKENVYITSNYWLLQVKYIYEIAFIIVMIIRDDNRSIHDLLLKTKVIRMDKKGKEIEESLFNDQDEKTIN